MKPYLRNIIIDLQKPGRWKVQLTIAINFIASKDVDEKPIMHSKNDIREFITYDNANDAVAQLFKSLLSRYQIGLETLVRHQILFSIPFTCCITNATRKVLNVGRTSYIDLPDWIKHKKATINQNNKNVKCFNMRQLLH